jgi:multidrug efflux pump subunit AcrA (membrane-fusion protein)
MNRTSNISEIALFGPEGSPMRPGTGKRRRWPWLVGGAVFVLLAGVAAGKVASNGHANKAEQAAQPAAEVVSVTVETVTPRPIRRTVTAVGSLWGWDEVPITPKVEGKVLRVHKDVGDIVKPGDVLVELDPTDSQLAVNEAKRGLELELARLGLNALPAGDVDVSRLPSVVRADALQRQAELRSGRMRAGGRAVTDEDLQQAETDVEVAKANRTQAVLEAKATLAAARQRQATLATALQRLADTRIVVPTPHGLPTNGAAPEYVVGHRKVAEGEMVRIIPLVDAPPLLRLVLDRPLRLQVTIPERHKAEVKVGQDVELEVESHPKERFAAKVARVNPAVDRASRTFMVEMLVPNADRKLSAGSFTRATIVTQVDDPAPTVPEEALVNYAGVTKVFVLLDGKAKEVMVKTGASVVATDGKRKRTWVEVVGESGELPAAAKVVTSGFARLADGVAAKVRE